MPSIPPELAPEIEQKGIAEVWYGHTWNLLWSLFHCIADFTQCVLFIYEHRNVFSTIINLLYFIKYYSCSELASTESKTDSAFATRKSRRSEWFYARQNLLKYLQKKVFTDSGKSVNAFLGLPYAAPPVGNLRFAPPKAHAGWNETLQATQFSGHCPQLPIIPGVNDQEDCLYLNIWTPEVWFTFLFLQLVLFCKNFYV